MAFSLTEKGLRRLYENFPPSPPFGYPNWAEWWVDFDLDVRTANALFSAGWGPRDVVAAIMGRGPTAILEARGDLEKPSGFGDGANEILLQ
jgi:hypothetical protein